MRPSLGVVVDGGTPTLLVLSPKRLFEAGSWGLRLRSHGKPRADCGRLSGTPSASLQTNSLDLALAREVLCNTRLDCQPQSPKFEPCLTANS